MDEEVIQAAKMAEEENSQSESVQIVSEHDLQNVSPEIRDLLDMFAKQNKQNEEQVNFSDLGNESTKKDNLAREDQSKEYLTLYATNEEGSAEPRVIQFNPDDVSTDFSTYFDANPVDMASLKSYQVMNIDPSHIKNSYPTFITPKSSLDSFSPETSSVKGDAEISLNSSGYLSASSPAESVANSPPDSASSPKEQEHSHLSRTLSPDPLSLPSPDPNVSENSNSMISNPYKIPSWVKAVYPELYQAWESLSASEFYQGGVELLCSICKKNPYSGFHENLPVCEADRVGRACTVCRLRSASGFSYGLALCEADRLFLYRIFSQESKLERCITMCPVTVQKWCGYCRFRTCLTTKGFRFFTEASTRVLMDQQEPPRDFRKRKYSGKGVLKELNFIPDTIAQDSVFIPNASSPGPGGFGCPTPAQAKQALVNGNTAQANSSIPRSFPTQSLAEANPTLMQALSQPISTQLSNFNQAQSASFAKPSFNLMPGLSKSEYASFQAGSSQFRAPTSQARVMTPLPPGVASSKAYRQQTAGAVNTLQPQPRAITSTPLPSSLKENNLVPMPTSNPQGRFGQFPPNMYMQHTARGSHFPPSNTPTIDKSNAQFRRSTPLPSSHPYPNQQTQYQHPPAYSPYPQQARQQVQTPYFNGAALGTRNKRMTGSVGVLTDPTKQNWVKEQQEKYLRFHMRLYRNRGK